MIALLQIIKLLNSEDQIALKSFLLDLDDGFTVEDVVDSLEDFLFNHFSISIELREREKESLVKIIKNGSAKSAFNMMEHV